MSQKKQVWVTTVDNPFDPFEQWDQWYRYDEKMGYHTCGRIARLANSSNDLTDAEIEDSIDGAIQRLIGWYEPYEVYRLAIEGQTKQLGIGRS